MIIYSIKWYKSITIYNFISIVNCDIKISLTPIKKKIFRSRKFHYLKKRNYHSENKIATLTRGGKKNWKVQWKKKEKEKREGSIEKEDEEVGRSVQLYGAWSWLRARSRTRGSNSDALERCTSSALYQVSKVRECKESRGYPRERTYRQRATEGRKCAKTTNKTSEEEEEEEEEDCKREREKSIGGARLLTRTRATRLTFMGIKRNCSSRSAQGQQDTRPC